MLNINISQFADLDIQSVDIEPSVVNQKVAIPEVSVEEILDVSVKKISLKV